MYVYDVTMCKSFEKFDIFVQEQKKMFKTADVDESSTLTPDEVQSLSHDILFPKYPRFGKDALCFEKSIPVFTMNKKSLFLKITSTVFNFFLLKNIVRILVK